MSSNNSETSYLLELNDDCIYEIYKRLPITSWCTLRETCTRLKAISDDRFETQFRKFEFNLNYISGSIYNELKMADVRSLLRNFGQCLPKLTINSKLFARNEDLNQLIPLLDRYCTELEVLKLVRIEVDAACGNRCDRLFSHLKRLVIDKCIDNDITLAACLENCRSLEELELIRLFIVEGNSLTRNYNTLKSFSLKSCNLKNEFIQEFLVKNPQLKKLKLLDCIYINDGMFQHIVDNLPILEELSVRILNVQMTIGENVMHLLRTTKLKKLEMNCGGFGINPFLNGLATKQLETLHLSTFEIINESVQALCNIKTLKVLKFSSIIESNGNVRKELYKKVASELPTLSEIHIVQCSNTTLNEVIEFAEYSTTLQKVVFIRYNDDDPSLMKAMFLSWIEARKRNSNKDVLALYLDYDDHREVCDQFLWEGNAKLFAENTGIIKILPLEDEEDTAIKHEYGSGVRKAIPFRGFYEDIEDEDDINHYDDLDEDDDYDDDDFDVDFF